MFTPIAENRNQFSMYSVRPAQVCEQVNRFDSQHYQYLESMYDGVTISGHDIAIVKLPMGYTIARI